MSDQDESTSSDNQNNASASPSRSLWFNDNVEENIVDVSGLIQAKANVLRSQKPVNWLPYLQAGLIKRSDYSFITAIQESKSRKERDKLLEYFKDSSITSFVTVAQRVCIVEEIQKFLLIIDDLLWEDKSRAVLFRPEETKPWRAFFDLLSCSDGFVRNMASRIIAKFISVEGCCPTDIELNFYLKWLKVELRPDNVYLLSIARCLQRILKIDKYRLFFYHIDGYSAIIKLLSSGVKFQAQYQFIYCLWVSSFNSEIAENLNNYSTIPVLMKLLKESPSEIIKLPRIIVATYRNLLEKPREDGVKKHNAFMMVQCHINKFLEVMKSRQKTISDQDFCDDLNVIAEKIDKYVAELSTFDEYRLELISRHLEWSVVHTSKFFWEKNAERLNENHCELLKILVDLVEKSNEPTVLSVAAHDLGEYMTHCPGGKRLVESVGAKEHLLNLLLHEDPMVRYHALKSLQILMLNRRDFLKSRSEESPSRSSSRSSADKHAK